MAISETKGRVESYPYQKASDTLTSTLVTVLFSSHPERERDREAHLNYYASAYSRGIQLSYTNQKLNQINTNKHASLTKQYM